MQVHATNVHGPQTFKCQLCDYVSTRKASLKAHEERVHEKQKNWFCKACSFSAYEKGNLVIHMRTHTGERPYRCKICTKSFARLDILHKHTVTKH